MQIVIKISEEKYNMIKSKMYCGIYDAEVYEAISNGTILPAGHGRLIDADEIQFENAEFDTYSDYCVAFDAIDQADTIIEADGGKCGMSDRQKLEKIQQTLEDLDKEIADKEVTRDYWEGFCKVLNAVEGVLNENSD